MDPIILILLWLAVLVMVVAGLAGAILPAIPGMPLLFGGLWLGAWIDGYSRVGTGTLVILAVIVAIGIAVDFIASALGAKRVGASPQAIWGSVLGSIVGMFFGLPGLVIGPFVGAVLGELSARKSMGQAANVGVATWMGLLFGTLTKLALSLVMLGLFVFAYFV